VIVPIVAAGESDACTQAEAIAATDADMVEWRADGMGTASQVGLVALALRLSAIVAGKPLVFTWRTADEGGLAATDAAYSALTRAIIDARAAALVDVQIRHPGAGRLIAAAKAAGVPVIGSWHDVGGTPPAPAIVAALADAEAAGADVAKVAVTARTPADVASLLAATRERFAVARIPLMTMAMGAVGLPSRLDGHRYGSQATFASVGPSSAPGQPSLDDLRRAWRDEARLDP